MASSTTVEVKQLADQSASYVGLDLYGRSKFPGCWDIVQPGKGPDGRWVTGFDDESISINSIKDPELRNQKKEELKELKEEFQRVLNIPDLSGSSSYWESYFIRIGKPLDTASPRDRMDLKVLVANNYVAPDIEARNDPDFRNTKYYLSRQEEEISSRALKRQDKDRASAELYKMREKRNKLLLVGKYLLGAKVNSDMNPDAIYEQIGMYLDMDGKPPARERTVAKFLEAVDKTVEELQFKLVIEEAVAKHVIRVREGYYQRGGVTYGKNLAETIKHLSNPENANEFASIQEELEEKRKFG